ncbi:putative AP2 protein [Hordeum vulgare]|nr:putative AP2 protein [Hordeum vulgare]
MSSRRRSSSGYRGVRECPSSTYYAVIRSGDVRLGLGMFKTAHEAVRAYDVAAWRQGRPRADEFPRHFHVRAGAEPRPSPSSDHEARTCRAPSAAAAPAHSRGGRVAHGGLAPAPPEDVTAENAY